MTKVAFSHGWENEGSRTVHETTGLRAEQRFEFVYTNYSLLPCFFAEWSGVGPQAEKSFTKAFCQAYAYVIGAPRLVFIVGVAKEHLPAPLQGISLDGRSGAKAVYL